MCIRDSIYAVGVMLFEMLTGRPVHLANGVAELALLHAKEAVSYTHLRAHETVLDLVCRLLLEKKNSIHN